jgi:Zn-dependent peptidase ImmA (M78 family)
MTQEALSEIIDKNEGIGVNWLKRIDKVFDCGLTWVTGKGGAPDRKKRSIFFRKEKFNTDFDFYSKKVVTRYEDLKFQIEALSKYINFDLKDKIKERYSVKDNPVLVAEKMFNEFNITKRALVAKGVIKNSRDDKTYLVNLIRVLEELNIFIFEHLEMPTKKDKVSFNGFFISPNIIVVKRQQKYLRREIFTLMHEFAHYLLNVEEVDDDDDDKLFASNSDVENWCHSFAYYFLLGDERGLINELESANKNNDFYKVEIANIYNKTKLSYKSIYTNLLFTNKISRDGYKVIMDEINNNIRINKIREKIEKDKNKDLGIAVFGVPKPIVSNIFKDLVVSNYFEGGINEPELRSFLNIKQKLPIDDVIYS